MRTRWLCAEIFLLLGLLPAVVRADRDEWRLGISGSGLWTTLEHAGSRSSLAAPGCGLRVTLGLLNGLEVGGRLDVRFAPSLEFRGATVEGDEGDLAASALLPAVALEARWTAGVEVSPAFWRTHPALGLRVGMLGAWYRGRIVLDDMNRLVDRYGDSFGVTPTVGVDAGIEHRFGRRFAGGVVATADVARTAALLGVNLELSWLWY